MRPVYVHLTLNRDRMEFRFIKLVYHDDQWGEATGQCEKVVNALGLTLCEPAKAWPSIATRCGIAS